MNENSLINSFLFDLFTRIQFIEVFIASSNTTFKSVLSSRDYQYTFTGSSSSTRFY